MEKNIVPQEEEILSKKDRYNELIMIQLRLSKGINFNAIPHDFKSYFLSEIIKWIDNNFVIKEDSNYFLSRPGKFYADKIASDLFYID